MGFRLALCALSFLSHLLAQTNATDAALEGFVLDPSAAAVSNAKVRARNLRTNIESTTSSNEQGYYRFALLPIGEYELAVEAAGFKEYKQTGVTLNVGKQVRVNVSLQVGNASESVTVTADASVVEATGQAAVGEVLNSRAIRTLPIISRNIYNFNLLGPGVKGLPSSGFGTTQFLFGGTNRSAWSVDGMDNSQRRFNRQIRLVINTPEAVEEMQVTSSGYSAEFGRAAGGQVNVITRSGTNELHGSSLVLIRPNGISARPSLARVKPDRTWEDYAFTLGGPIKKDRLFFFGQYEYNPLSQPNAITITPANAQALAIPDAQLGNADFGEIFHTLMGKVNYRINDKNTAWFRYSRFTNNQPFSGGGLNLQARGTNFKDRMNGGAAQLATVITPSLFNEFRFGVNRRYELRQAPPNAPANGALIDITNVAGIGASPTAGSEAVETSTQFIDNLTYTRGRHTFKTGVDFQTTGYDLIAALERRFLFQGLPAATGRPAVSALNQYLFTVRGEIDPSTSRPYTYTQLRQDIGERNVKLRYNFLNLFAQDEFRVARGFTLNLGVRYEALFYPTLDAQAPFALSRTVTNDLGNIAPRVGFAWIPFADGKTVVRGAYGLYYDTPSLGLSTSAAQTNGRRVLSYVVTGADTRAPRFPALLSAADPSLAAPPSITAFSPDFQTMVQQQANLQVQRALTSNFVLNLQFSHAGTRFGAYSRDINLPAQIGVLDDGRPRYSPTAVRPDPRFRQINLIESGSNSQYNALDVTLNKRFSRGLQFSTTWSWSHARADNEQEGGALSDPTNRRFDYATRNSDLRHSWVLQGTYAPEFANKGWKWVNGFQFSTMTYFNSGFPVNVSAGADLNGDLVLNDRPLFRGRNDVKGPELFQVDFRILRQFTFFERFKASLIAESENVFNKTNAGCSIAGCSGAVVSLGTAADFGRLVSARNARNIQLGFQLNF